MTSPSLQFKKANVVVPPITDDREEQEVAELEEVFRKMNVTCDGRVTQREFRAYLTKNPRGWPLADLLAGQSEEVKNQIVDFWFRKLDLRSEKSFTKDELIAFFRAMKQTKYQEMIYADFLLNLFDTNYDGKLDRQEYANMLHVLLGRDVPAYVLSSVSAEGLTRDDLVQLLHAVRCDLARSRPRNVIQNGGGLGLLVLGMLAGAALVLVWHTSN